MKTSLAFRIVWVMLVAMGWAGHVQADIADESNEAVEVRVQLMNGDKFPGFEFSVHYVDPAWGELDEAYQRIVLKPEMAESTGYESSRIFARDSAGHEYTSKLTVGGTTWESWPDFAYYVVQVEILRIVDGVIEFKVVSTLKMDGEGNTLEIIKGEVGSSDEFDWIKVLMPLACLLGLIAFFVIRQQYYRSKNAL